MQSILKFKDIDEAIDMANDTHYGLAAGVYTKDLDTAIRVANSFEAGTVWWAAVLLVLMKQGALQGPVFSDGDQWWK